MGKLATCMGTLLLGGASLVTAQPTPPTFDDFDSDGSGVLSQEEVVALLARFAGRGPGGAAGGPPAGRPGPTMIFERWDANGDGAVSREEFDARPRMGPGGPRGGPGRERPQPGSPPQVL